jgi:hypothetical protein
MILLGAGSKSPVLKKNKKKFHFILYYAYLYYENNIGLEKNLPEKKNFSFYFILCLYYENNIGLEKKLAWEACSRGSSSPPSLAIGAQTDLINKTKNVSN